MKNENTKEVLKKNTGFLVEIRDVETGELFCGRDAICQRYGVNPATVSAHLQRKVKKPRWEFTEKRVSPK